MYIMGIDGGGTHTRVELRSMQNETIRRAEFGSFHMLSIGEAAFRRRLAEIFAACGGAEGCACLCIGGAGISGGAMEAVLRQELADLGFGGQLKLVGDHEIALAGAVGDVGCILIAGTGSICCGRNAAGEVFRTGGFGHLLDDGGSGYALGRDALALTVRSLDGRSPADGLTSRICRELDARDAGDIIRYVYQPGADKSRIAALAPAVLECAEAGESSALRILEHGADALAELVLAMLPRLGSDCPKLCLMGGLSGNRLYRDMILGRLAGKVNAAEPRQDALWGAAQMAYESIRIKE